MIERPFVIPFRLPLSNLTAIFSRPSLSLLNKVMSTKRRAETNISPPPTKRKVESSTTNETVKNFFKPTSSKELEPSKISWRIVNNRCVIGKYTPSNDTDGAHPLGRGDKRRVAAFDLDHTLIATSSGKIFSKSPSDWKWWHADVPKRLKELHSQGYLILVLSNQKGISLKKDAKKALNNFKQKVASVFESLDIPLSVYAATELDEYRKPRMGMWREMLDDFDLDVPDAIDLPESIFVGDAAGRPGDHSCSDRNFAANIGIPFKTPEEYFLGEAAQPLEFFDPLQHIRDESSGEVTVPFSKANPVDLVIFCGSPGAGKSTFYWKYLQRLGYERVNQDILKSRPKCLKVAKEYLREGKSVAVDNTNANPETRAEWVSLANNVKVPIRCIYMSTPLEMCKHNNAVRAANPKVASINPESRGSLPMIAFNDYTRRFTEPSLSEGFQDITRIDFQFRSDGDAAMQKAWGQHFF